MGLVLAFMVEDPMLSAADHHSPHRAASGTHDMDATLFERPSRRNRA
jgi:hypothetical protein